MDKIGYRDIIKDKREDMLALIKDYFHPLKYLNFLTSLNQSNISLFIDNIVGFEKLQIYYSGKTKLLYSSNTSQEEAVEYQMTIYNLNYTPTEKEFYNNLTEREKRMYLDFGPEEQEIYKKYKHNLESIDKRAEDILRTIEEMNDLLVL